MNELQAHLYSILRVYNRFDRPSYRSLKPEVVERSLVCKRGERGDVNLVEFLRWSDSRVSTLETYEILCKNAV